MPTSRPRLQPGNSASYSAQWSETRYDPPFIDMVIVSKLVRRRCFTHHEQSVKNENPVTGLRNRAWIAKLTFQNHARQIPEPSPVIVLDPSVNEIRHLHLAPLEVSSIERQVRSN